MVLPGASECTLHRPPLHRWSNEVTQTMGPRGLFGEPRHDRDSAGELAPDPDGTRVAVSGVATAVSTYASSIVPR